MQKASDDLKAIEGSVTYLMSGLQDTIFGTSGLRSQRAISSERPFAFTAGLRAAADAVDAVSSRLCCIAAQIQSHTLKAAANVCADLGNRATRNDLSSRELNDLLASLKESIEALRMIVHMCARRRPWQIV